MRSNQRGQIVLVEFALAAVGLVAIAFVAAKVGGWLNQSMVERNASFQGTRVAAGQSNSFVGFAGPSSIHLIGDGPESTGGAGPAATGEVDVACSAGADALFAEAQALRHEALNELSLRQGTGDESIFHLEELEEDVKKLTKTSNELLWAAELIEALLREIEALEMEKASLEAALAALQPCLLWEVVDVLIEVVECCCETDCDPITGACWTTCGEEEIRTPIFGWVPDPACPALEGEISAKQAQIDGKKADILRIRGQVDQACADCGGSVCTGGCRGSLDPNGMRSLGNNYQSMADLKHLEAQTLLETSLIPAVTDDIRDKLRQAEEKEREAKEAAAGCSSS